MRTILALPIIILFFALQGCGSGGSTETNEESSTNTAQIDESNNSPVAEENDLENNQQNNQPVYDGGAILPSFN